MDPNSNLTHEGGIGISLRCKHKADNFGQGNVQFSGLIIIDTNSNILLIMNSTLNISNCKKGCINKNQ